MEVLTIEGQELCPVEGMAKILGVTGGAIVHNLRRQGMFSEIVSAYRPGTSKRLEKFIVRNVAEIYLDCVQRHGCFRSNLFQAALHEAEPETGQPKDDVIEAALRASLVGEEVGVSPSTVLKVVKAWQSLN